MPLKLGYLKIHMFNKKQNNDSVQPLILRIMTPSLSYNGHLNKQKNNFYCYQKILNLFTSVEQHISNYLTV